MKDVPENVEIPDLPDYISVKEAAEIIGLSTSRVYQYIKSGRLPARKVGDVRVVPREEVQKFKRSPSGRLRSKPPDWKTYQSDVEISAMVIQVQVRKGQQKKLMKKLRAIGKEQQPTFPGTIARHIFRDNETIQIELIWKDTEMPDEITRQQDLRSFQRELADVLDWDTAQTCTKEVLLHT